MSLGTAPLATYRIQFNQSFRFEDARALVPYLSRLGVTHVYSSPLLRARSGSAHGYDVVDPRTLNPELGDETQFRALVTSLRALGMGLILDIVPNHMAAASENPYWQHVLTYGLSSPYARWFDIDWRRPDPELWGRVLVPVLGDRLPRILAQDQLCVSWLDGRFRIQYFDHHFPIDPATVPDICLFGINDLHEQLEPGHPALSEMLRILKRLRELPRRSARIRRKVDILPEIAESLLSQLARVFEDSPQIREWVERTAQEFGAGKDGHKRLRRLLAAQSYRLVYWRRAARILNYRRFFDINDLIAVRQEDPEVFQETHALIVRWVQEGLIDGVRVDHVDGLRDPRTYLERLRDAVTDAEQPARHCEVYVEKILGFDEELPDDWPVAGTTGYDFLNQVEAIFLSPAGTAELEKNYRRILGRPVSFAGIAAWGKRRVLKAELSAFVGRLAGYLLRLAHYDPQNAGLTQSECVAAIVEFVVALPVYRTYIGNHDTAVGDRDRRYIETALHRARKTERAAPEAFDVLEQVLLLRDQEHLPENIQQERLNFIQRLQQLTGPATAKGIEDTALYVFVPLASRNEVGSELDAPIEGAVEHLHGINQRRASARPGDMLCATTHDTKRTADARSRLDVLSELPKLWGAFVARWRKWNKPHHRRIRGRVAPDPNTEYLLYQTLVGIWPAPDPEDPDAIVPDGDALNELRERAEQYMLKAVREAKIKTSWVDSDEEFEEALLTFVRSVFLPADVRASQFLGDLHHFVARIARPGLWNALSRTLVQYTSPGMPDLYQGDELWNFALVDPDNRRPVDYELRKRMLDEIVTGFEGQAEARREFLKDLVDNPEDGRIKLHLIRHVLHARSERRALFADGDYEQLQIEGAAAEFLFGFARTAGEFAAITLVPRLVATLVENPVQPPIGAEIWKDTRIVLPDRLQGRTWRSVLTGEPVSTRPEDGPAILRAAVVLADFPGALLLADG
jgi:(1->4)-alpha-D-glucan 1-alpha-D-glucosylmutase